MTLNTVITKLTYYYKKALELDYVQKPLSWALYQTWKFVDAKENKK